MWRVSSIHEPCSGVVLLVAQTVNERQEQSDAFATSSSAEMVMMCAGTFDQGLV